MKTNPLYKNFQEKRAEWISYFSRDDNNSITNQIEIMLHDDAFFRLINEIRRIRLKTNDESKGINGHLSELLDRGYVVSQSTAIRCQIDKSSDVISIGRLLDDFIEHRKLITRKNYVTVDNTPYDPEDCNTDLNSCFCTSSHNIFDTLSSSLPSSRTPYDLIDESVFIQLKAKLDICKDVKKFSDKFLAHKSTPKSRKNLKKTQLGIALDQIAECHKTILSVTNYIYGTVLRVGEIGGIPPLYNENLEYFDKPWISKKEYPDLHEFWNDHMSTVNNWTHFNYQKDSFQ